MCSNLHSPLSRDVNNVYKQIEREWLLNLSLKFMFPYMQCKRERFFWPMYLEKRITSKSATAQEGQILKIQSKVSCTICTRHSQIDSEYCLQLTKTATDAR